MQPFNNKRPSTQGNSQSLNATNRIAWKIPKTTEMAERINKEGNRFEEAAGIRKFGKMFLCPPKAENIHQLIEEQRLYEKKQALNNFLHKSAQAHSPLKNNRNSEKEMSETLSAVRTNYFMNNSTKESEGPKPNHIKISKLLSNDRLKKLDETS